MRDPKLYLIDIREALEAIEHFVKGIDFEAFKNEDMRSALKPRIGKHVVKEAVYTP